MKSVFDKITALVFCLFCFGFLIAYLFYPAPTVIAEERREANEAPRLSADALLSGALLPDAEAYLLDAIPCRSVLVSLHARACVDTLHLPRCHGVRVGDYGIEKLLPTYDGDLVSENLDTVDTYLQRFLDGKRAYAALIPHKGYYTLSQDDYDRAWQAITARDRLLPIAVADTLTPEDYFLSDVHIRPECYGTLAAALGDAMCFSPTEGLSAVRRYTLVGTLARQLALAGYSDTFSLLYDAAGLVASAEVFVNGERQAGLYDESALADSALADPYDAYLGGETGGVIVVKNPHSESKRRLVVFRDSFARAIVPYLLKEYSEIVLVDLRTPYRRLLEEEALFADDATDILLLVSTHTLLTTKF